MVTLKISNFFLCLCVFQNENNRGVLGSNRAENCEVFDYKKTRITHKNDSGSITKGEITD